MSRAVLFFLALGVTTSSLAAPGLVLEHLGTHATGIYDPSAAEIGAHDPRSQRLFITNTAANTVDVLDLRDPRALPLLFQIQLSAYGASPPHWDHAG